MLTRQENKGFKTGVYLMWLYYFNQVWSIIICLHCKKASQPQFYINSLHDYTTNLSTLILNHLNSLHSKMELTNRVAAKWEEIGKKN